MRKVSILAVMAALAWQGGIEAQKGKTKGTPIVVVFSEGGDLAVSGDPLVGEVSAALTTSPGGICIDPNVWNTQEAPGEIDPTGLLPTGCGTGQIGVNAFAGLPEGTDSRRQANISWTDDNGRTYRLQYGDAYSEPVPNYVHTLCTGKAATGSCNAGIVDTFEGQFPTDGSEVARTTGSVARLTLITAKGARGDRILGYYRVTFAASVTPAG